MTSKNMQEQLSPATLCYSFMFDPHVWSELVELEMKICRPIQGYSCIVQLPTQNEGKI